jgi:heme exporter protein D
VQAVATSIVAVLGTLLGAVLSYGLQRRMLNEVHDSARRDQRQQHRLAAFGAFAAATMDLRRAEYDRWNRRVESPDGVESVEVRQESYRLRGEAWNAFFRLKLVADPASEAAIMKHAEEAVQAAASVSKAPDAVELRERGERARQLLETFVEVAAVRLRVER